jgi:hypothetical protein
VSITKSATPNTVSFGDVCAAHARSTPLKPRFSASRTSRQVTGFRGLLGPHPALVAPFPVDAEGHQHCLALNDAVLAYLLVARVEYQVGPIVGKPTLRKLRQTLFKALIDDAGR